MPAIHMKSWRFIKCSAQLSQFLPVPSNCEYFKFFSHIGLPLILLVHCLYVYTANVLGYLALRRVTS